MGAGTPPGTADGVGVPEAEVVEGIHGDVKKVPETGDEDQNYHIYYIMNRRKCQDENLHDLSQAHHR